LITLREKIFWAKRNWKNGKEDIIHIVITAPLDIYTYIYTIPIYILYSVTEHC